MDGIKTTNDATKPASPTAAQPPAARGAQPREARRRRWEMTSDNIRYFLPKPGSSEARPDLGREMPNEGEALVEAFKSGQVLYTLVAWKAVPEMNGNGPVIVKQALART
jgi:hypothetical protein